MTFEIWRSGSPKTETFDVSRGSRRSESSFAGRIRVDILGGPGLPEMEDFEHALATIPLGYSEGHYLDRRYGVTLKTSDDNRRVSLFGEALDGSDLVSFNLYRLARDRIALRPCEMPEAKVVAFVLGYRAENHAVGA
jgi:hypothetical protein